MPINHTPRFRRFVNIMALVSICIGLFTILLLLFALYKQRQPAPFSCETWMEESIAPLSLKTSITDRYTEQEAEWLSLSDSTLNRMRLCPCESDCDLAKAATGDSLFKESGSTRLILQTAGGSRYEVDFPCCE